MKILKYWIYEIRSRTSLASSLLKIVFFYQLLCFLLHLTVLSSTFCAIIAFVINFFLFIVVICSDFFAFSTSLHKSDIC